MSRHTAEHAFDTPEAVALHVENGRGSVVVTAGDVATTKVHVTGSRADEVLVEQQGTGIVVIAPKVRGFSPGSSLDIEISVPSGSDLDAKLGGASIETTGQLETATVRSGSGRIRLDRVAGPCAASTGSGAVVITEASADLRARSGSGRISVERIGGAASVSTGSGAIRLGTCAGLVMAKTGSGAVSVDDASDDVTVKTGSGSITVGVMRRGRAVLKGASGNVSIGIPAGTPVWTDVRTANGRVRSDLPSVGQPEPGADYVEVRASTASGNVQLTPA
jgi:hypothetical protein